ncbi:hypothetical protein M3226_06765 [Neobacillus cucumis]|uniref:hypothetical protein n=1 Tax=Neobacillus cucumis TaxID=1740721 RepID=UPI00203A9A6F|nr:hypothetical protein [Neobacillus cucumis]MCM3725401.1 hypothetical protein [Neobacillus cucumis]
MMERESKNKYTFEFDEKGTMEVSQQILNSYNTGFIGEGTALADSSDFSAVEE